MDIVDYDGARIRLIRFNYHMSYCKLLGLLWLLSSWSDANNQSEIVTCCIGDDAKFPWTGDVPPFIVIEWYFNNTLIAQTYRGSLSQDTLIIEKDYEDRFHLTRTGDAGFYITNARENDTGEYKCVVTMQGTGEERVQQKPLKVIAPDCQRRRRAMDSMAYCRCDEAEPESGEEQPPASDSPGHVHPAAVAVPVVIGVICVVIVVVVIKRKGFPSAGIQHVESRSELPELEKLEDEIKSPVAEENGMGSQILMKDTEA